jgi:hypothetical protein
LLRLSTEYANPDGASIKAEAKAGKGARGGEGKTGSGVKGYCDPW